MSTEVQGSIEEEASTEAEENSEELGNTEGEESIEVEVVNTEGVVATMTNLTGEEKMKENNTEVEVVIRVVEVVITKGKMRILRGKGNKGKTS